MFKRTVIFGLAFGAGFAVVVLSGLLIANWYGSRPKAWDTKSITCVSSTAVPGYVPGNDFKHNFADMKIAAFTLVFALSNNTERDFTLPKDMKLLKRSARAQALTEFNATVLQAVFLPPKDRAELTLSIETSCGTFDERGNETERDPETCFHDALGDATGFVALNEAARIRVDLPKPALRAPTDKGRPETQKAPTSMMLPPNKGDVFDRVTACNEAARLVNLCDRQGIRPTFAAYSGYRDNLESLPIPPKGYKLDASQETCDTAYEWKNYCKDHKK